MKQTSNLPAQDKLTIGVLYGFRALMVLIVCHYHIWQQSWLSQYFVAFGSLVNLDALARSGYMFVDGMLLMSGFLLYLPYARESVEGIPAPSTRKFYRNRVARIVPSYLLAVLLALVLVAIPQAVYRHMGTSFMVKDLFTHFTFTFNLFSDTLLRTPLNGVLWTVAVEVQFYLIFPFLARSMQKKPGTTLSLMALVGVCSRLLIVIFAKDTAPLINQMPTFLDVYALGMLGALLYVQYQKIAATVGRKALFLKISPWLGAVVFALAIFGVASLLQIQASKTTHEAIRQSQMALRLPFALVMLWAMLSAAIMPRFLQKLLDNRLLRFLSTISFNLYIWHQLLSVQIKHAFFDAGLQASRNQQIVYTLLCFGVSILVAMAVTYGVEHPCSRLIKSLSNKGKEAEK